MKMPEQIALWKHLYFSEDETMNDDLEQRVIILELLATRELDFREKELARRKEAAKKLIGLLRDLAHQITELSMRMDALEQEAALMQAAPTFAPTDPAKSPRTGT